MARRSEHASDDGRGHLTLVEIEQRGEHTPEKYYKTL
ncbi:YfcL family protein [Erwinia oleae]|nr:YfcL family protein [Erwinia oleae]